MKTTSVEKTPTQAARHCQGPRTKTQDKKLPGPQHHTGTPTWRTHKGSACVGGLEKERSTTVHDMWCVPRPVQCVLQVTVRVHTCSAYARCATLCSAPLATLSIHPSIHSFTHLLGFRAKWATCTRVSCACATRVFALCCALSVCVLWCTWSLFSRVGLARDRVLWQRPAKCRTPTLTVDTFPPRSDHVNQHTTCPPSTDLPVRRPAQNPEAPLLCAVRVSLLLSAASWIWSCEDQKKLRGYPPGWKTTATSDGNPSEPGGRAPPPRGPRTASHTGQTPRPPRAATRRGRLRRPCAEKREIPDESERTWRICGPWLTRECAAASRFTSTLNDRHTSASCQVDAGPCCCRPPLSSGATKKKGLDGTLLHHTSRAITHSSNASVCCRTCSRNFGDGPCMPIGD